MQVTKFTHSCLLVEENGLSVLFDPGIYTNKENSLDPDQLKSLDYILITHEHLDHLYPPLILDLKHKFPEMKIITNQGAAKVLMNNQIDSTSSGDEIVKVIPVPHEEIFGTSPTNWQFDVFDKLTQPGDSHSFTSTKEILALPITAPWGSMVDAVKIAVKLKPKVVIPIHDWHWKDDAKKGMYDTVGKYLGERGIRFIQVQDGVAVEI